ncbi:MAG: MurR/RpiR family transcriptional regulator [Lachnotalea sp.]
MLNINTANLNPLEKKIYKTLIDYSKSNPKFRITKASELCDCSVSKISKFAKKLGFENFKQYLNFLYGENMLVSENSSELTRIKNFIEEFDKELIDEFLELIISHEKIVFFGYGPSLLCAQYFEYRLRTCTNKMIVAVSDEISVSSTVDENTLLIILTVTGTFHSFKNIYNSAKNKGCNVAILVEEYNTTLFDQCDKIFWLSKVPQPNYLKPYEKSRTIFFIFLEEVIQQIQNNNLNITELK